jgi:hypothetical protein
MTKRLELLTFKLEHKPPASARVPQSLADGILEVFAPASGRKSKARIACRHPEAVSCLSIITSVVHR